MLKTNDFRNHIEIEEAKIICSDGISLGGNLWHGTNYGRNGKVIINPATGVISKFYHRYARFLAAEGFDVLTYDYRGIGNSRPVTLNHCGFRWRDWGEKDFDAAVHFMHKHKPETPLMVVGHSVGGYLPGLADNARRVERMLTVGAQYAWCGDYAPGSKLSMFFKWHIVMPALTAIYGYFPGSKLGWLEDLPAGVANEWSFRRSRFEMNYPPHEREKYLSRMASLKGEILAVSMMDDEFGTIPAVTRTLDYYEGADRTIVRLHPRDFGRDAVGHFNLFHDRHITDFWKDTLLWLQQGINPWPSKVDARF